MTAHAPLGDDDPARQPTPRVGFGLRRSVFWRVASILVGVQVATALLAVALSAFFANERSLSLAKNSLELRIDNLAQRVAQPIV